MPKLHNETHQEYRDRAINPISPSFCGAKWYNATVWLNNGMTASCHHPPAHKIPVEEILVNYKALHNTEYKKNVRQQMIKGERPSECDYCWKVESMGPQHVSDRVYKSIIYSDIELQDAATMGAYADVDLKTLEIAFDSNCNFACSYCNASFSTTWQSDIKVNGPYQNMVSDGAGAFQQDGSWTIPYGRDNENNPYMAAFWQWWETDLQFTLKELRVTGGEPSMSKEFWKLMDWFEAHPECNVNIAVNSNLGQVPKLVDRLVTVSNRFKKIDIYTSMETFGQQAEYIRDGLVWGTWTANVEKMLSKGNFRQLHCMMTLNALCLMNITKLMDYIVDLRKTYPRALLMSFNILRFPSFQAIPVLPMEIRKQKADEMQAWLDLNGHRIQEFEREGLKRTIAYTLEIEEGHSYTSSLTSRHRDFKSFFTQYDERRGKSFGASFPELAEWYNSLPKTIVIKPAVLVDGNSGAMTAPFAEELKQRAKEEGWIQNPQGANPGSKDYTEPNKDV